MSMSTSNKTPSYRLKANANYHSKTVQKPLRFKLIEDADLLTAIDNDSEPLNQVANNLLRVHYDLPSNK